MAHNLTDASIKKLSRPDRRVDYKDAKSTGLVLRLYPTGVKTWRLRYMREGRAKVLTLGSYPDMGVAEARARVREHHAAIKKGRDPHAETLRMPTLEAFVKTFIERYAKPNNKDWYKTERLLRADDVIERIGAMKMDAVERVDLVGVLDQIRDRGAYTQANRTLAALRKMFAFAVERGVLQHSPATHIKATRETPKDTVLDDSALKTFWAATERASSGRSQHYLTRHALRLMLLTAARNSEVCGITFDELDLDQRIWTLPAERSKNGFAHTVPLSDLAIATINEASHGADEYLFPSGNRYGHLASTVAAHAMASIFPDTSKTNRRGGHSTALYTPHDLRRTVATRISAMGYNRLIVDKVLNHKDNSIGGVYDRHTYDSEKRSALDAWGDSLRRIVDIKK